MKKLLLIGLLLCYGLASFGVSLNYFYCCGKLKSVTIAVNANNEDDCTGPKGKGCCDNKTVTLKIKTVQKNNDNLNFTIHPPVSSLPPEPVHFVFRPMNSSPAEQYFYFHCNSKPPPPANPQAYTGVFRI